MEKKTHLIGFHIVNYCSLGSSCESIQAITELLDGLSILIGLCKLNKIFILKYNGIKM